MGEARAEAVNWRRLVSAVIHPFKAPDDDERARKQRELVDLEARVRIIERQNRLTAHLDGAVAAIRRPR